MSLPPAVQPASPQPPASQPPAPQPPGPPPQPRAVQPAQVWTTRPGQPYPLVVVPPPAEVLRALPLGPAAPTMFQRYGMRPSRPPGVAVFAALVAAALVGALVLVPGRPGLSWLLVGLTVAAVGLVARLDRRGSEDTPRPRAERLVSAGWAAGAVALLAVTVLRADGWLAAYCLIAALACGSLALSGGRTAKGLLAGAGAALLAVIPAVPWLRDGTRGWRRSGPDRARIGRTVLLTAALLLAFGALLTSADAAFREVLARLAPGFDAGRLFFGAVVLVVAAGAATAAARRPGFDTIRARRVRPARRAEWAVPLAALDALFLAFVLVQLAVLFGGEEWVLRPGGPSYADYARSGFWQLVVVTLLTLAVLGVALRFAPRAQPADRLLLRVLLGGLSLLALVIVASAVRRLALYEQAYGFTRLRVLVGAVELWLALLFVLVIAALVSLRTGWLPRVVLASGVLLLVGVGLAGPDRFVADQNVRRYHQTGRIDTAYLSRLSPDAVPALVCLPEELREPALADIAARLRRTPDDWRSWNLGRAHARRLLADGCG